MAVDSKARDLDGSKACAHVVWRHVAGSGVNQPFTVWCPACGALGTAPGSTAPGSDCGRLDPSEPLTWVVPFANRLA